MASRRLITLSSFPGPTLPVRKAFLLAVLLHLSVFSFSQTTDSTRAFSQAVESSELNAQAADSAKAVSHFSGAVSVTNNGISLVPTFSLGDPAVLFNLSIGKKRLTFEPDIRFALEGKPWSFLFWWRYKLLRTEKLSINIGAHPALNFRTVPVVTNGGARDVIETRRFLAGEVSPNYFLSKNVSVGTYYLYSHGIEENRPKHTHFLTLNGNFSDIRLTDRFFMRATPQFYYLKQDARDGFYFSTAITLARRNFPLALSAILNKTIQTEILASKELVWNVSLVYFFNKQYVDL